MTLGINPNWNLSALWNSNYRFLALPLVCLIVVVAYRSIFRLSGAQGGLLGRAALPRPQPSRTDVERIHSAAASAVKDINLIPNNTLQIEIQKFVANIEFEGFQLLNAQREPKLISLVVENVEHELHCIQEQIAAIRNAPRDQIDKLTNTASPQAYEWLKQMTGILISPADRMAGEFERLIVEGRLQKFLNQPFLSLFGGTLFHHIAKRDLHMGYIEKLKNTGFDVALQDLWGNTGLIWACANASNGAAREIMTTFGKGVYLDIQCFGHANSAMHIIVAKGYKDRSMDGQLLAYSNLDLLKQMIALGANLNLQNADGYAPLHLAYLRRDVSMVGELLRAGADPTLRDKNGKLPKELAKTDYNEASRIIDTTVHAFLLDRQEFESIILS